MKSIIRKILFTKSVLYLYPYSSLNLDNDLSRIYKAGYFFRGTILRGKDISKEQFVLWEKWDIVRGMYSCDALAYFSGSKVVESNKTYIISTIYPKPIFVLGFYITIIIFITLFTNNAIKKGVEESEIIWSFGFVGLLFLSFSLYFRKRIQKSVEHELNLEKYKKQN